MKMTYLMSDLMWVDPHGADKDPAVSLVVCSKLST